MSSTENDINGCAACGITRKQGHGTRYTRGYGDHRYIEPTDAIRLARMKARRAARQQD